MKLFFNRSLAVQLAIILSAINFTQCKKFVEIDAPTTQLVAASVFDNNSSATAAQTVIYSQMANRAESFSLEFNTGLLGDELTNYSTNPTNIQFYTDDMTALQTSGPWNDAYNYIFQANAIIAALQDNAAISPAVQQQLTGESKFIRAFWLFYLTSLYGDIPLVTSTNYTVNGTIARSPQPKVYQQIISDLVSAEGLLSSNYIDASDTTTTTERTRPTKWAAAALLARAYLYSGDYTDAKSQAALVIGNTGLYGLVGIPNDSVFKANSLEAIWQLAIPSPNTTAYDVPEGYYFPLTGAPGGTSSANCCTLSPQLLQSFEPGDKRRTYWVDSLTTISPAMTYYYPYKYQIRTTANIEYTMVFRLAEEYLIRAEAETQLNDLTDGAADLNVIRNRAGLSNIADSISSSQSTMMTAILHERQVELFTEWGHRWIDLGRSGIGNAVMGAVAPEKNATWNPDGYQLLFPIPQSERNVDPNLTQNAGY
jgi:hypothetical protein